MPDENKGRDAVMLEESAQGTGRKLGQSQTTPKATLDDLSDDEIKEQLKARGLEVRKQRRPKSTIARPDNVDGKRRITVHLSEELRLALQAASTAVNRTESNIAEEALTEWMDRNKIRSGALGPRLYARACRACGTDHKGDDTACVAHAGYLSGRTAIGAMGYDPGCQDGEGSCPDQDSEDISAKRRPRRAGRRE